MPDERKRRANSVVADAMRRFVAFSDADVQALRTLESQPERARKGTELVTPGQKQSKPFVVIAGSVLEYRVNADGGRQALDLLLPGEIVNLRSTVLGTTDIYMVAAEDSIVSRFGAAEFHALMAAHPKLGAVIIWRAAVGRSMLAEHLLDVGRRTAYQRVGHRLLELLVRMELAGLARDNTLTSPLELTTLSDMLGLSLEHTSRTLARLRSDGLIAMNGRRIRILDRVRLAELCEFDQSYLHPDGLPE